MASRTGPVAPRLLPYDSSSTGPRGVAAQATPSLILCFFRLLPSGVSRSLIRLDERKARLLRFCSCDREVSFYSKHRFFRCAKFQVTNAFAE